MKGTAVDCSQPEEGDSRLAKGDCSGSRKRSITDSRLPNRPVISSFFALVEPAVGLLQFGDGDPGLRPRAVSAERGNELSTPRPTARLLRGRSDYIGDSRTPPPSAGGGPVYRCWTRGFGVRRCSRQRQRRTLPPEASTALNIGQSKSGASIKIPDVSGHAVAAKIGFRNQATAALSFGDEF